MTAGLAGLLGIGAWIAALILAGVLANLYSIAASNKRPVKVQSKELSNQRRKR